MTKNSQLIKKLVGLATLTAIVIVLQYFSGYMVIGSISITLALLPIAMGAILYGPLAGFFLGAVMGIIVLIDKGTHVFLNINVFATIVICIFKSGLAGLCAGYLFKLFAHFAKKVDNEKKAIALFSAGVITASIITSVVNTGLFILGATIFFRPLFGNFMGVVTAVLTTNFAIEVAVCAVLSPAVVTLIKILTSKYDLAFANDFSKFNELDKEEIFDKEEVLQN